MRVTNITDKFSEMNVSINYQRYILIALTFLKVLILIRQVHQKRVLFATIGIF